MKCAAGMTIVGCHLRRKPRISQPCSEEVCSLPCLTELRFVPCVPSVATVCASEGAQSTLECDFEPPAEMDSIPLRFLGGGPFSGHFLTLSVWPYPVFSPLQILSIQK